MTPKEWEEWKNRRITELQHWVNTHPYDKGDKEGRFARNGVRFCINSRMWNIFKDKEANWSEFVGFVKNAATELYGGKYRKLEIDDNREGKNGGTVIVWIDYV